MSPVMAFTVAVICSLVMWAGPVRVPVTARWRISAVSFLACVSVIHWPTTVGSPPASSAARYWASCRSHWSISARRLIRSGEMASCWPAARSSIVLGRWAGSSALLSHVSNSGSTSASRM
ncbi:MAG: hypothetical protein ACR2MP_29050 [Streptosporangiaceae bacterium]